MKELFHRYLEGTRLYYDILSSKGTFYYTVEMLRGVAISCECRGNAEFKKHCKHMTSAEIAERELLQNCQNSVNSVKTERALPPLNGNRAFSLLR